MKRLITAAVLAATLLTGAAFAQEINEIGGVSITKSSKANIYRPEKDVDSIQRNYQKQPPLIPHSVQGYEVSKNFNKCMDCHGKDRAEETGAPKVAKSHYLTRDDDKLKNISPRRYFCMQCHVPQFDAKPLVENTYKPANQN